ncbi:MAG: hypothetical protein K2Z81_22750, partial [Cyanobacteria bacterium]|nr:hypothetical protein [Cyanobacteriota bacterium]
DLNDFILSQTNATANVDGIAVASGLNDVTIQNGTIRSVSRTGIAVGSGCSRITIDDIWFEFCAQQGIALNGTSGSPIIQSNIQRCSFFGCSAGVGASTVISAVFCNVLQMSDITCSTSGGASSSLTIILLNNCPDCNVDGVLIQGSSLTSLIGIRLQTPAAGSSTGQRISNCIIRGCTTTGSLVGYQVDEAVTTISEVTLDSCWINGCTAGSFIGFNFFGDVANITVLRCIVNGLSSTTNNTLNVGFFLNGASNCTFKECKVNGCSIGVGSNFRGYLLGDVVAGTLANTNSFTQCHAMNNTGAVGANNVTGFSIVNGNSNTIVDGIFMTNSVTGAPGNGTGVNNTGTNMFVRNIGFANNTTGGTNQFSGVALTSVAVHASTAVSTPTIPWTNLSVPG